MNNWVVVLRYLSEGNAYRYMYKSCRCSPVLQQPCVVRQSQEIRRELVVNLGKVTTSLAELKALFWQLHHISEKWSLSVQRPRKILALLCSGFNPNNSWEWTRSVISSSGLEQKKNSQVWRLTWNDIKIVKKRWQVCLCFLNSFLCVGWVCVVWGGLCFKFCCFCAKCR